MHWTRHEMKYVGLGVYILTGAVDGTESLLCVVGLQVYRKHFPDAFKSHINHDIVLVCIDCHTECDWLVQRRIAELADQFNAPLDSKGYSKYVAKLVMPLSHTFSMRQYSPRLTVAWRASWYVPQVSCRCQDRVLTEECLPAPSTRGQASREQEARA